MSTDHEFTCLFPFCGLGGGALGFVNAEVRLLGRTGRFRSLGGIDNDPLACADFEALTGSPALCQDIATMTAAALRAFAGESAPDVVFGSNPCLPGAGLVLTDCGPREIRLVKAGDLVLTHKGRYRHVREVGNRIYRGEMVGLRLNGTIDVQEFTLEHPIWRRRLVRERTGKRSRCLGPAEFVQAREVRTGDRIGFPVEPEVPGCAERFIASVGDPRLIVRKARGVLHGRRRGPVDHEALMETRVRRLSNRPALWFLLGVYLGDGYRTHANGTVSFCVGATDSELAAEVRRALLDVGLFAYEDRNYGTSNVKLRVSSRHLSMLAARLGDGAARKDIPCDLLGLERPYLLELLRGYRASDGCALPRRSGDRQEYQARWAIASISLPLLRSFQRLLLRLGIFGCINVSRRGGPMVIEGRTVQTRPQWEIAVREGARKRQPPRGGGVFRGARREGGDGEGSPGAGESPVVVIVIVPDVPADFSTIRDAERIFEASKALTPAACTSALVT